MKLKGRVKSLDEVAESFRGLYEQDGDWFYLKEYEPEDTAGLKSALEKEREERRRAKESLDKFKDVDPEKYRELLRSQEDSERKKLESKGAWEALEKQLLDKHSKEMESRDTRIKTLTGALEKRLIDAEATTAIASAKGVPQLLLPHVRQSIKVFEEDGEFVAKVVDSKGNPRIGDAKGTPMTISQLVDEIKQSDVYGRAFEASGAGGSGATNQNGGGANGVRAIKAGDRDALNANIAEIASGKVVVTD